MGGCFIKQYVEVAAQILGLQPTVFEDMEKAEYTNCGSQWAPFHNEGEWDLAHFLMKNVGQTKMDEFLKLLLVHVICQSGVSFANACAFLKYVDSLQTGPAWTCEMIDIVGDVVAEDGSTQWEQLELWHKDPVKYAMAYVPECAYKDSEGKNHIYDEIWTADWWWDVQGKLPAGAMVAPIILSSDKTSLSVFSGNKKAWPVYLTIGNILKDIRQQVSMHAMILIGYLPVSKLKCFKKTHSLAGYCLFHHAMLLLLQPLVDASCNGKVMIFHPILAAYVADFPEQCLVACNKESQKFDDKGLHAVYKPFWKDLPFTNIFTCITPNILHQLHKGIFHDHLLQWCVNIVGEKEVDTCFKVMSQHPGIFTVSQWTGTEHKEMQRVFMGLLSGTVDDHILIIICSLLDFIYYAWCQQHTDLSLKSFHDHKHVLIDLGICEDFNVLKIHSFANGYNTEYPDNKCDYMEQMVLWLQQQEAIHHKSAYLAWRQLYYAKTEVCNIGRAQVVIL
ncbi:hypothetical protein EDC04DRAFT_2871408 [Pisolithus marmoratus]|nr:hypothetical protein EDC04DRAFT_2871408 [Pisolithus marmoratus]